MIKSCEMTQDIFMMKKTLIKTLSIVVLATSISTPAFASSCNVSNGDSMWRIAKRYHLSFKNLCDLNRGLHEDIDLIHPRDKVLLPHEESEGHATNQPSSEDQIQEGDERTNETQITQEVRDVLDLVNQERAKNGLSKLTLSNEMTHVATMKAQDMRDKNYFSHNSPTYGSPFEMLQQFGIKYSYAGENIAGGQQSAQAVMTDWLNSSGHRANILNKNYTEIGIGYVKGGQYGTYWVQLFRKP